MPTRTDLTTYVEHFRARVLQDALNEATAAYWLRRAAAFAAVGTPACDDIARACRARAALAPLQTTPEPATWAALADAA